MAVVLALSVCVAGSGCSASADDGAAEGALEGAVACADAISRVPAGAFHREGRVDPDFEVLVTEAARTCLREYVRIDTSNPATGEQAGEIAAVRFFEGIFAGLAIPTRRAPLAGASSADVAKRASVIATLAGRQRQGSVVLLNHTDVVHAEGAWKYPPFSGNDDGTFIWGRGTLDMKHVAIAQMMAMVLLKKAGIELLHDVHFAAVADEEVGGRGAEFVALKKMVSEEQNEQIDPLGLQPGVVLNEGGTGIRDALVLARDVFVIGVEEKGALWTQFAHRDLAALLRGFARIGAAPAPPDGALVARQERARLGAACKVTAAASDEGQAVNVVPRHATITLRCTSNEASALEAVAARARAAFSPAPRIVVTPAGADDPTAFRLAIEAGSGGHGSAGGAVTALQVATAVLVSTGQLATSDVVADDKVRSTLFAYGLSPANQAFVANLGRTWGKAPGALAGEIAQWSGAAGLALRAFHDHLPTDAPFRNTCYWTTLAFPVDGEARAKLDCRTTFDTKARDLERGLAATMADLGLALRTERAVCTDCYRQEFNASPFGEGAKSYGIIQAVLERSSPDVIATPYLFPASSDSYFFRRIGVPTYGIAVAALGEPELRTFHGLDERFPIASLFPAVRVTTETVARLANEASVTLTDAQRVSSPHVTCEKMDDKSGAYAPTSELVCETGLMSGTAFRCTRGAGAPRFLRVVPRGNDARFHEIVRLRAGARFDGAPSAADIEKQLYRSRETGDEPSTRVFDGKELEVDTGAAPEGRFFLRCTTPSAQAATFMTRTKLEIYRD